MKKNILKYNLLSIILILFCSFICMGFIFNSKKDNNSNGIKWISIEEAYELNKVKKKKILIDVYTSWCGWCKKMDKTTFSDKSVSDYANKHYYAVKLDAESMKKVSVHGQFTTPRNIARSMYVNGYPTIVFMHEDFKTINVQPGYKSASQFLNSMKVFNK